MIWHSVGMAQSARRSPGTCRVLVEDPELAEELAPELRDRAELDCLARTVRVPVGPWGAVRASPGGGLGLLVLDGLLIRRVGVHSRFGAELLGAGDLLRPWQGEDGPPTLPITSGWSVIEPVRMAVLDARFAQRAARYPPVTGALVGRALGRARNLAINMAIVHQARVDVRVSMLLWHLATRWGKVCGDHVSVPLRLTHSVLADLVAARRPTVTSALGELSRQGSVRHGRDGWLLFGRPPGELLDLTADPAALGAQAQLSRGERAAAP